MVLSSIVVEAAACNVVASILFLTRFYTCVCVHAVGMNPFQEVGGGLAPPSLAFG